MFKNKKDLLQQKEEQLARLSMESQGAVQMVCNTIEDLCRINHSIEQTIAEIDTYVQQMSETRAGLDATRVKNEKIMNNFSQLLSVD